MSGRIVNDESIALSVEGVENEFADMLRHAPLNDAINASDVYLAEPSGERHMQSGQYSQDFAQPEN